MKHRIKQNFYTLWGYDFQRIPKEEKEKLKDDEYWSKKDYWFVKKELPNGRLYAGWGFSHPTKLTKDDLPEDYIFLDNYKKCGYIRTAGIKSLVYNPSPFHNHSFKDDFLYISYTKDLGEFYRNEYEEDSTYKQCDEYIFGSDIIDFIFAVEKFSPNIDTSDIKMRMVEQYNAYVDEMNRWEHNQQYKKIDRLEDLIA